MLLGRVGYWLLRDRCLAAEGLSARGDKHLAAEEGKRRVAVFALAVGCHFALDCMYVIL